MTVIEGQFPPAVAPKRRPGWVALIVALAIGLLLLGAGIGVLALRYDR